MSDYKELLRDAFKYMDTTSPESRDLMVRIHEALAAPQVQQEPVAMPLMDGFDDWFTLEDKICARDMDDCAAGWKAGRASAPVAPPAARLAHDLYKDGDANIPDSIKDRNGQVVLELCKRCGKAEIDLDQPCTSARLTPEQVEEVMDLAQLWADDAYQHGVFEGKGDNRLRKEREAHEGNRRAALRAKLESL